jgi:SAM-dependent methyltransferase
MLRNPVALSNGISPRQLPQEGALMRVRSWLYALTYDPLMSAIERAGLAAARAELLATASGRVLEIGAGTGLNIPHYPAPVTDVIATEPDAAMSRRLERAAARASLPVTALRAPAEDIPYDDATFDTVVSTLVLCSVDDQPRSVRELWRVLKPGGSFLFLEHVCSDDARVARRQDRLNWLNRLTSSCDCNRPTLRTLERAGFAFSHIERGELPRASSYVRPMISGRAIRPDDSPIHLNDPRGHHHAHP